MRVLKFGGKSLESLEKVQNICKFIKKIYKNDKKIIIVVSAMGDCTNSLIEAAKNFGANEGSKRELALLLSTGEIQSAALFGICLKALKVPAKCLTGADIELLTFGDYVCSKVAYLNKSKIDTVLNSGEVAVICGFQGVNHSGEVTTLGRGGSDTTALALAATFDVKAEIYSDFDGVFSGDPRIAGFKQIRAANFDTMLSASRGGAKVLDESALEIAKNKNITILSKSSAHPERQGTTIGEIGGDVIFISSKSNLSKITISFSNPAKMEMIFKNVISSLKNFKFLNLTLTSGEISFFVSSEDLTEIICTLSQKLKLIKKQD